MRAHAVSKASSPTPKGEIKKIRIAPPSTPTRSGYYASRFRQQAPVRPIRENARLLVELKARHRRHRQCYGSPRMTADLRAAGWTVNRKRIARLMRSAGIRACGRCRRRYKTWGKIKSSWEHLLIQDAQRRRKTYAS